MSHQRRLLAIAALLFLGLGVDPADAACLRPGDGVDVAIGVREAPPFIMADPIRGQRGLTFDLWESIERELGEAGLIGRTAFVECPLGDQLDALASGDLDLVISPLTITAERLERLRLHPPVPELRPDRRAAQLERHRLRLRRRHPARDRHPRGRAAGDPDLPRRQPGPRRGDRARPAPERRLRRRRRRAAAAPALPLRTRDDRPHHRPQGHRRRRPLDAGPHRRDLHGGGRHGALGDDLRRADDRTRRLDRRQPRGRARRPAAPPGGDARRLDRAELPRAAPGRRGLDRATGNGGSRSAPRPDHAGSAVRDSGRRRLRRCRDGRLRRALRRGRDPGRRRCSCWPRARWNSSSATGRSSPT